jgi:glycosyltransferase involved in cell wall biosynthesis
MARLKPLICHVIPWQLFVGGAQRFVAEMVMWARDWSEQHVIYLAKLSDATWNHQLKGCTLHAVNTAAEVETIIDHLNPDLIHHHHPESNWGLDGLSRDYPKIGTPHGWAGNIKPVDWSVKIAGPQVQVRHGIDLDQYSPKRLPSNNDGSFHVGIVGRIRHDKIPASFIDELRRWNPKRHQVVIHFVGRGLDDLVGRRVQESIRRIPNCRLHGDIPPDEMPGIYRQLDCVLIPSARDSVSLVAIEAMACGIPVIARDVEGLPDTVGDAGVVRGTDAELLAAVDSLRRDHSTRREFGVRGRARAVSLFEKGRMLSQYGTAYESATRGVVKPPWARFDVTVAMPVADGVTANWLRAAVDSVWDQRGVNIELILVNDGVTDPDLSEMIWFLSMQNIVVTIPERRGISNALNEALRVARSDLIARADADDIIPRGRLAAQVKIMRDHPDVAVLCGDMARITTDGGTTPMPVRVLRPDQPVWEYWVGNWPIAHPTVMFRRFPIMSVGGYDPTVDCGQDLDLWCRLQAAGYRFRKENVVWNHYRVHPNQQTARRAEVREATTEILARYTAAAQRQESA